MHAHTLTHGNSCYVQHTLRSTGWLSGSKVKLSAANWAESEAPEVATVAAPFNPSVYVWFLLASPVFHGIYFPAYGPRSLHSGFYFGFRYLLFCSPPVELAQRSVCVAGYVAGRKCDKRAFRREYSLEEVGLQVAVGGRTGLTGNNNSCRVQTWKPL